MPRRKLGKLSEKEITRIKGASTKSLNCKKCSNEVIVDSETVEVICGMCTTKMVPPASYLLKSAEDRQKEKEEQLKYPKGWRLFKFFVLPDGKVYERGVEKPELHGTMEPTDVDAIRKERKTHKKSIRQKNLDEQSDMEKLAKKHERAKKEKEKANLKKEKQIDKLVGEN